MMTFINHGIVTRKPEFDFSNTPIHWMAGDALNSHMISSAHAFIPEVEYLFCRLSNLTLPYVEDSNLRTDIRAFVEQEAAHANAHKAARAYLEQHGIDPGAFTSSIAKLIKNLMGDAPLGMDQFFAKYKRQWLTFRMGMIAAWEHYFCFIGTWAVTAGNLDQVADPAMLDLMRWHGAEEVEHRTVAFDAYRALAGNGIHAYIVRQAAMAVAFPLLVYVWLKGAAHLGKLDGTSEGYALSKKSLPRLLLDFARTGRKTGRLPLVSSFLTSLLLWMKPGHHPEHDGDVNAAMSYLDSRATRSAGV